MILVRNTYHLTFGGSKEAMAAWREGAPLFRRAGANNLRFMTDYIGRFFTLIHESEYKSYDEFEAVLAKAGTLPGWAEFQGKFRPLVVDGHREVLRIVEI